MGWRLQGEGERNSAHWKKKNNFVLGLASCMYRTLLEKFTRVILSETLLRLDYIFKIIVHLNGLAQRRNLY